MKKFARRFIDEEAALDEQIFQTILMVGVVAALVAFALVELLRLGIVARVGAIVCAAWFAALQYAARRWSGRQRLWRVLLVCGLGFVIYPIGFFSAGATESGMILLYLINVLNIALLLRAPLRGILIVAQIAVGELSVALSYRCPQMLSEVTMYQRYAISKLFLLISCVTVAIMLALVLAAYEKERARGRALTDRLASLSVQDPLSGLYNRRELFRRMELLYRPEKERSARDRALRRESFCVAMFDIDDFKRFNDTYGHQFGDKVLSAVACQMRRAMDVSGGELAARYGGEEFVCVFRASDLDTAFSRVDAIRGAVEHLDFPETRGGGVTVSCGVVHCGDYESPESVLHDADALLYQAKHDGKNRVETRLRTA